MAKIELRVMDVSLTIQDVNDSANNLMRLGRQNMDEMLEQRMSIHAAIESQAFECEEDSDEEAVQQIPPEHPKANDLIFSRGYT